jgi:SpoVK/Ycf46/Vps4 family AAA+-type ATPase
MKALDHMKTRATPGTPKQLSYTEEEISAMARACQGLTQIEIDNTIANSITHLHRLDIDKLIHEKRQIIRKSQILEFVETPVDMNDVGGLDLAKQYLSKYAKANSDEAREFGVEPLKGILLTGVPGTGKSLLAKAIGRLWQEPLLRLDVGKVMTGLVGGSEEKMREVINQAEAMAPCVTGDTLVTLASGKQETVQNLHSRLTGKSFPEEPIRLVTIDETGELQPTKLYTVVRRHATNRKLLQITTESGKIIKVTENHRLLVRHEDTYSWKEASELHEGDDLVELDLA